MFARLVYGLVLGFIMMVPRPVPKIPERPGPIDLPGRRGGDDDGKPTQLPPTLPPGGGCWPGQHEPKVEQRPKESKQGGLGDRIRKAFEKVAQNPEWILMSGRGAAEQSREATSQLSKK